MRVLYVILVLSTIAVVAVAFRFWRLIKTRMHDHHEEK
jgi:Flp pilus assembly protein TadB